MSVKSAEMLAELSSKSSSSSSPLLFSFASRGEKPKPDYFYIQGDSNSQGLRPDCAWNLKIGMGRMAEEPWPSVMEKWLTNRGIKAIVENCSETGRRLAGKTHSEAERSSIGAKDGRVALQQMVGTIFNKHGVKSDKVHIIINLGTNDLQDYHISKDYLKGSLIKHILTVLINPNLQYALLEQISGSEKELKVTNFFEGLNRIMAMDIAKSYSETVPITEIEKSSSVDEMANHGSIFNTFIDENSSVIRDLFSMINWNFVIVPPVLVRGYPFGSFANAALSQHWPNIVDEVVKFFDVKNIYSVKDAQKFCIPSSDEMGGSLHLTPQQHKVYGEEMGKFFASRLALEETAKESSVFGKKEAISVKGTALK